jgi:hypothetical protein
MGRPVKVGACGLLQKWLETRPQNSILLCLDILNRIPACGDLRAHAKKKFG